MTDEVKRSPLYRQVSDRLAGEIAAGTYPPGALLPSETEIMNRFAVSRPTVRAAIRELRELGLAESRHGYGTVVLDTGSATALDQTITHQGTNYTAYDGFTEAEQPLVTRTHVTAEEAVLLQLPQEDAAFQTDRLLLHEPSGNRAQLRVLIPLATAEQYPVLAETPSLPPADIYTALTTGTQPLTWQDFTRARPARPDERTALATDHPWLLVRDRVTYGGSPGHRALILETLSVSANRTLLTHRHGAHHPTTAAESV